ncbi:MAG: hypothetical protein WD824_17875 [Cyclobacteriaceae bacterium]
MNKSIIEENNRTAICNRNFIIWKSSPSADFIFEIFQPIITSRNFSPDMGISILDSYGNRRVFP